MLLRCVAAGLAALSGLGSAVAVTAYAIIPGPALGLGVAAVILAVGCFIAVATFGLMAWLQEVAGRLARLEQQVTVYGDERATDAALAERSSVYGRALPKAVGEGSGDVLHLPHRNR
jgi:hypothetical protein